MAYYYCQARYDTATVKYFCQGVRVASDKSTGLVSMLLCSLLAQTPLCLAHLPELFGKEYILAEEKPASPAPEPKVNALMPLSEQDRDLHESHLEDLADADGPYATGLTDPLINLGYYHRSRGDLEESIEAYSRALHLVRINDGLTSELQLPILRAMIEIYRSVYDYESLGNLYQYYSRVRNFGVAPHTAEQLDASLEYLEWERELYGFRPDGKERVHLLRAFRLNERMLESLTPETEEEVMGLIRLTLSQMRNLYLILGDDPLAMDAAIFNSGQGRAIDAINREMSIIQKLAFSKGKLLLQKCIDQSQLAPPTALASIYLELGDWNQWNGQLRNANEQYAQVETMLLAANEDQLLQRWLGEPAALPDEPGLWPAAPDDPESQHVVVEASYAVTHRGDVKRIEVSVSEEEQSWQAWRIRNMLRETHFRPRFHLGQPETVEQVSRQYLLVEGR